ncbi:hypothetical protein Golob_014632 [Gossypium lobatum]|uniref:RNase H type-1 domain-containing protein n=1 Tax=Gossypium lobatum TaxID=34289 RepID=A0A7J8LYQ3_9ROSI|nr:hypothetical protein [Gossypium lobatum]
MNNWSVRFLSARGKGILTLCIPGEVSGELNDFLRRGLDGNLLPGSKTLWKQDTIRSLFGEEQLKKITVMGEILKNVYESNSYVWKPPINDTIKINFDTSFNQHSRRLFSGIIARNKEGLVMASCTYSWENISDPVMARRGHVCRLLLWQRKWDSRIYVLREMRYQNK